MSKRASYAFKMRIRVITVRHRLDVCIFVFVATYLLCCGDVEVNPGPATKSSDKLRQTRLQSNRSLSADNHDRTDASKDPWEPSLRDVVQQLTDMNRDMNQRFDTLNGHFDTLNDSVSGLREEVTQLTQEMDNLQKANEQLQTDNNNLADRLEEAEKKMDDLEGRSKRNNLIFTGLKAKSERESWEDCEELVQGVLRDQLKFQDEVQFDRVHRLHRGANSPIVARCTHFKDKQRVLKNKRVLSKCEGCSNVFIGEDFTKRVRDVRKKLVPFLKDAKADKTKKATMVFDHLVIDGKRFYFDADKNTLTPAK